MFSCLKQRLSKTNNKALNSKVSLFSCTAHSLSFKIYLSSSGDTVFDYFHRWPQSRGYSLLSLGNSELLVLFKSKENIKGTKQYKEEAGETDD